MAFGKKYTYVLEKRFGILNAYINGAFGLYTEDARVRIHSVNVEAL